ncbi:MAG TPA: hypothetical protein PKD64_02190 [Pirellulaceae bacterium]|nr:hypothetical protein [Pirellulaceae bacterium]HMO90979.1 hypothetical protein [Pirellulaceae bacterium]HMP68094.1 hypothetical protein [Pirellulaceae bacterium]
MSQNSLVPSTLLFRFAGQCRYTAANWTNSGLELSEEFSLPHFASLDGQRTFAEVRAGWNEAGLYFDVKIFEKRQSLWCRASQLMDSDRVMFWIDTRDTHTVHRATKFCHWFLVMPVGGGNGQKFPLSTMLKINRCKEDPPTFSQYRQQIITRMTAEGYRLLVHLPKACLHGWDPKEHQRIGFNYAIHDRELGVQTLAVGAEFPVEEDPSLWQTLELVAKM